MIKTLFLAAGVAATALITAPAQSQVRLETRMERPDHNGPRYRERRGYEERRVVRPADISTRRRWHIRCQRQNTI